MGSKFNVHPHRQKEKLLDISVKESRNDPLISHPIYGKVLLKVNAKIHRWYLNDKPILFLYYHIKQYGRTTPSPTTTPQLLHNYSTTLNLCPISMQFTGLVRGLVIRIAPVEIGDPLMASRTTTVLPYPVLAFSLAGL
jgi:hypothetical protein